MYLDIAIAKLIEADHSNNIEIKNDLLQKLLKNNHQSSILNTFIELDKIAFNYKYETIDDYLYNNENKIPELVDFLIQAILPPNTNVGLHRNSLYLSESGLLSSQLPSHYKFDRALANILRINSSLINKENLIVPKHSNTIRIYLEFAVLDYQPSIHQIQILEKINIKKYHVKNQIVDNVFDPLIEKLPIFKVYK